MLTVDLTPLSFGIINKTKKREMDSLFGFSQKVGRYPFYLQMFLGKKQNQHFFLRYPARCESESKWPLPSDRLTSGELDRRNK